jgi:hypothetical protein
LALRSGALDSHREVRSLAFYRPPCYLSRGRRVSPKSDREGTGDRRRRGRTRAAGHRPVEFVPSTDAPTEPSIRAPKSRGPPPGLDERMMVANKTTPMLDRSGHCWPGSSLDASRRRRDVERRRPPRAGTRRGQPGHGVSSPQSSGGAARAAVPRTPRAKLPTRSPSESVDAKSTSSPTSWAERVSTADVLPRVWVHHRSRQSTPGPRLAPDVPIGLPGAVADAVVRSARSERSREQGCDPYGRPRAHARGRLVGCGRAAFLSACSSRRLGCPGPAPTGSASSSRPTAAGCST